MTKTYITRSGEQVYPLPVICQEVQIHTFLLLGKMAALRTLCQEYFGQVGGAVSYSPFSPLVMITFTQINAITSGESTFGERGRIAETEVALWVLTVGGKSPHLAWFNPYIFVDNSYALSAGRELYGFPKQWGQIQIQTPTHFAIETLVLDKFALDTQATSKNLIEIERTQRGVGAEISKIGRLGRAWGHHLHHALRTPHLVQIMSALTHSIMKKRFPMVFLKQFRAEQDSTEACYQALLEADIQFNQFHKARLLLGNYRVKIGDYASHPILHDFGLQTEQAAIMGTYSAFDFTLTAGREIWRAEQ